MAWFFSRAFAVLFAFNFGCLLEALSVPTPLIGPAVMLGFLLLAPALGVVFGRDE